MNKEGEKVVVPTIDRSRVCLGCQQICKRKLKSWNFQPGLAKWGGLERKTGVEGKQEEWGRFLCQDTGLEDKLASSFKFLADAVGG